MTQPMSAPAGPDLFLPSSSTIISARDQIFHADDQPWSPTQSHPDELSTPLSNTVRNYAEATPFQFQAELDDASVVSENPKYGCDADCHYCDQPCVGMFFISVVNITAGGECTNHEVVFVVIH